MSIIKITKERRNDIMGSKIDRVGERNVNNFGSKMVITKYRNAMDIDVYFPEYDWIAKNRIYGNFKKGSISCPYEPSVYGIGYISEGDYKSAKNRKHTKCYQAWYNMLERCYDEKLHERNPTYKDCEVDKYWYNFQNFAKWYYDNYYTVDDETMCLDKDILVKHNKMYSPETCIFVPQTINKLFIKSDKSRGSSVIGTSPLKNGKYRAYCNLLNPETGKSKRSHLGVYNTQEKAFEVYKQFKENYIKQIADYYKEQIPISLYNALYEYEVEITD